jgi:undecaprenyl pyrophosphate phosphatase UppP
MLDFWNIVVGIVTTLLTYIINETFVRISSEALRNVVKCLVTLVVGIILATAKGLLFNEFTIQQFWANLPAIFTYATLFYGTIINPAEKAAAQKDLKQAEDTTKASQ